MLGQKQTKWVNALWSETFPQAEGALCVLDDGLIGHCCLGVAKEIFDLNETNKISLLDTYQELGLLGNCGDFAESIIINGQTYYSLAEMNDAGKTFREIATIIQNYWFLIFERPV